MRCVALIFAMMICGTANAELVSRGYVDATVETRVDTSKDAKQVMAGEYTVSGTLHVPTPPLPPAD